MTSPGTEREPLPRTPEDEAEDEEFFRRYGPWDPLDPQGLRDFMDGFPRPWWLIGGWAIEAFTGRPREHEDIDLSILSCDIPALREHVGDAWHLWSNDGGTFRALNDTFPEVLNIESQIWVRRSAMDPWVIDIPLTPDRDGLWTNKRIPDHVVPLDEATWIADDGLRYLNPEIALLFKSAQDRTKDRRDLRLAWPLLGTSQREWLLDAVAQVQGSTHAWLELTNDLG